MNWRKKTISRNKGTDEEKVFIVAKWIQSLKRLQDALVSNKLATKKEKIKKDIGSKCDQ